MASTTTEYRLPYPTEGDAANTGAAAIRNLALAVERTLAGLDPTH